jgi:hypothetical protein
LELRILGSEANGVIIAVGILKEGAGSTAPATRLFHIPYLSWYLVRPLIDLCGTCYPIRLLLLFFPNIVIPGQPKSSGLKIVNRQPKRITLCLFCSSLLPSIPLQQPPAPLLSRHLQPNLLRLLQRAPVATSFQVRPARVRVPRPREYALVVDRQL